MASKLVVPPVGTGTPEELAKLHQFLQDLVKLLDGGLAISGNCSVQVKDVVFRGAGVETPIDHGLGRVPVGWLIAGTVVTAVSLHETARERTDTRIFLQSSVAGAKVKLLFF